MEGTHTNTHCVLSCPLYKPQSLLHLSLSCLPPVLLVSLALRGALSLCMMSSLGAPVFGRRLCLSYEMKRRRWNEKKETEEVGENFETPGGTSLHILRICLTASQAGVLHLPRNTRGIITDQNKLPICSQQRCVSVKSPELHKIHVSAN